MQDEVSRIHSTVAKRSTLRLRRESKAAAYLYMDEEHPTLKLE